METDTVVVGGGLSGLSCALRLTRAGRDVLVLDAQKQPGGNLRTRRVTTDRGEWLLELGPNSFGDASEDFTDLVEAAGLTDRIVRAREGTEARFLYLDGELQKVATSPVRFLLSNILPPSARLRLLREPFVKPRPEEADEESLAEFCDRRLGRVAREKLLTPMIGGIYAGDPTRLGAESAFPKMVAMEREHGSLIRAALKGNGPPERGRLSSFVDGLSELPDAVAHLLGDAYRSRTPVTGLTRGDSGWTVKTAGGDYLANHVVLATPAWITSALLDPLQQRVAEELSAIAYAPMAVVHVGLKQEGRRPLPDGFGFLVPRDEGMRILGCIFSSRLFPGRAPDGCELLTVFTGGRLDPDAYLEEDEIIHDWVLDDLGTAFGEIGEPELLRVTRWPSAIPQYDVGHGARLRRIEERMTGLEGLHLIGNWKDGIAMPRCVAAGHAAADAIVAG